MLPKRLATAAGGLAVLLSLGCRGSDDTADPAGDDPRAREARRAGSDHPGTALIRELGCGACHAGLPDPGPARDRAPAFGDAGRSYEPGFLLSYLQSPARVRPDIGRSRMPDFHLSEPESLALSLYLLERSGRSGRAGADFGRARRANPAVDAELGRRIFRGLNCAGCHRGTDVEPWSAGPRLTREGGRAREAWLRRWLARPTALRPYGFHPGTGSRMPDFRLAPAEVDTVTGYLLSSGHGDADPGASAAAPPDPAGADSGPSTGPPDRTAFERQKAEALLRDRHSCLGCHRLGGEGGRIGPALDGVASRRREPYLRRVLAHPDSAAPGSVMPRIPMTSERRRLLVGYLSRLDSAAAGGAERSGYLSLVEHPVRPPTARERHAGAARARGGALYRATCASCHGSDGAADGYNARYLPVRPAVHASADSMARHPDGTLFDGIWAGGRVLDRSHRMPPFGGSLTRRQARSLVEHIRELCECRGPEWAVGRPAGDP